MADLTITADLLTRAAKRNGYAIPTEGLIFFGIRGFRPDSPFDNAFTKSRTGRFSSIDFLKMNCTIGQWKVATDEIALFPGSTVPSQGSIVNSKNKGGIGTNMLMLGRFEHEKGVHKLSKPGQHRAFRQATFFPVWRTADNTTYDLADKADFGGENGTFVWDNLHSAYYDDLGRYSSAGCQVVCGLPERPIGSQSETGPWRTFINNAYGIKQKRFVYLLFSAEELAFLEATQNPTQVVRFGSTGPLAREVQNKLIEQGLLQKKADGNFGRASLSALMTYQAKLLGSKAADGVCGTQTAEALGIVLPPLSKAKAAPQPGETVETPGNNPDLEDETDLDEATLAHLLAIVFGLPTTQPPITIKTVPPPVISTQSDEQRSRANFERAQALIKEFEGGYSNNPKDKGGPTNFGITHKTLAAWRKKSSVSAAEVKAMSYDEARDIYFANYWNSCSCGAMPGPLALPVYNISVHSGPGRAGEYLQRALNKNGAALKVDGDVGDNTLKAIAAAPLAETIDDLIDLYDALLKSIDNYATFKGGFTRRVKVLRVEADKWLTETDGEQPVMPTPKIDDEGDTTVTTKDEALTQLIKMLNEALAQTGNVPQVDGAHQPGVAAPGTATPSTPTAIIGSLLTKILENKVGKPGLTPVNGALGTTIGNMLDGRKSFLGILGSVLSSLLSTGSPLLALIPALGPIAPIASALLPLFLGLAAWGGLGKMDKYAAQQK
jgi:lysozyme family protein